MYSPSCWWVVDGGCWLLLCEIGPKEDGGAKICLWSLWSLAECSGHTQFASSANIHHWFSEEQRGRLLRLQPAGCLWYRVQQHGIIYRHKLICPTWSQNTVWTKDHSWCIWEITRRQNKTVWSLPFITVILTQRRSRIFPLHVSKATSQNSDSSSQNCGKASEREKKDGSALSYRTDYAQS